MNKTSLDGKIAIVTGAASGIGRASALLLAERGAKVVVADVDEAGGSETAKLIGDAARFVPVDVADESSFHELVSTTLSAFGRLDIAHNNAGIIVGGKEVADTDKETWDRVISVNLTGMFIALRAEVSAMLESGGGSIINMSSVAGVVAQPGQVAYITTKHGVIGLTKAAAVEYSGRGIRVNALLPGTVNTPLVEKFIADNPGFLETIAAVPIPRPAEPAEIAEAVAWLASDASSFVTGASLSIDGGFVAQ